MKKKHYFQDLIEILTNFKVGLLLLDEELNVEEILNAEERSINRDKITNIREKIIKVKNITNFLNEVLIESKITPNKVHVKYIKKKQPIFLVSIDPWQEDEKLYYVVKFYVKRVLIGLNVSRNLMKKGFKNKILNYDGFKFPEYNGKPISDQFKKESYSPNLKKKPTNFIIPLNYMTILKNSLKIKIQKQII